MTSGLSRARLLGLGHIATEASWQMKAHFHPFHELIVLVRGGMTVHAAGEEIRARAGDVLLYPARVSHQETTDPADPGESLFLAFRLPRVSDTAIVRVHDARGRIRQMIQWLHEDQRQGGGRVRREGHALLASLLEEFVRLRQGGEADLVSRTRAYAQDHLAEALSLDVLASQAALSKYYFLRAYKALTGHTPMEDVRAWRVACARDLLLSTSLPMKDIAPRAGLGNECAMSRAFRRQFGMPPGEFRRHSRRR